MTWMLGGSPWPVPTAETLVRNKHALSEILKRESDDQYDRFVSQLERLLKRADVEVFDLLTTVDRLRPLDRYSAYKTSADLKHCCDCLIAKLPHSEFRRSAETAARYLKRLCGAVLDLTMATRNRGYDRAIIDNVCGALRSAEAAISLLRTSFTIHKLRVQ